DDARAVHRDRREPPARDQIDDERAQSDLDRVRAHAEHDRTAAADRGRDARDPDTEVVRREDVGETRDELAYREPGAHRTSERLGRDPALPARERHGPHPGEVESGERPGSPPRSSHAVSTNS